MTPSEQQAFDKMRDALWVCAEHNALHFSAAHNTVTQARAALAAAKAVNHDLSSTEAVQPFTDGDTAKLVNTLRDIAIEFHDSQQLRERIAQVIRPLATAPQLKEQKT